MQTKNLMLAEILITGLTRGLSFGSGLLTAAGVGRFQGLCFRKLTKKVEVRGGKRSATDPLSEKVPGFRDKCLYQLGRRHFSIERCRLPVKKKSIVQGIVGGFPQWVT